MSTYHSTYKSILLRFDDPFAYITLTDFEKGRGLLQIHSDWGTYSYYWGSMGEDDILNFLARTSPSYVHEKLQSCLNYMDMKKDARVRLDRFMIKSWPAIHECLKLESSAMTIEKKGNS